MNFSTINTVENDTRFAATKHFGKYPGIVLKNDAPDNNPEIEQDYGKCRGELLVEISGLLEEVPSTSNYTSIAEIQQRPMQVYAKPCFSTGTFFVPEIGDKVWVEFIAGDPESPLWTGTWYQQDKFPKTTEQVGPTRFQKVLRTVSGHVIQLDDTEGEEKIIILHKSGSMIDIEEDGKITITDTGNDTSIVSNKISFGTKGGAAEKIVLGDTLKSKLEELIDIVQNHVHPTGVGPSGTPVASTTQLTSLKSAMSQILSQQNTTD